MGIIKDNIEKVLKEIPSGVELIAATKKRSVEEIREVIFSGIKTIGENYVKEAEDKIEAIGSQVKWHLIGHLQKNKVKLAVKIFDVIETVDSLELATLIDKEAEKISKTMSVLIEVNSAGESQKQGVSLDKVYELSQEIAKLKNIKLIGLMTMGPVVANPEQIRPFFKVTRKLFEDIKSKLVVNQEFCYLSMGMSGSYKVAIEEGANIVRLGTVIFGPRER